MTTAVTRSVVGAAADGADFRVAVETGVTPQLSLGTENHAQVYQRRTAVSARCRLGELHHFRDRRQDAWEFSRSAVHFASASFSSWLCDEQMPGAIHQHGGLHATASVQPQSTQMLSPQFGQ
jgi:formate dehydrogenase assembly factor FdhD